MAKKTLGSPSIKVMGVEVGAKKVKEKKDSLYHYKLFCCSKTLVTSYLFSSSPIKAATLSSTAISSEDKYDFHVSNKFFEDIFGTHKEASIHPQ